MSACVGSVKDNIGAKMAGMELEREKGITIRSAATFVIKRDQFLHPLLRCSLRPAHRGLVSTRSRRFHYIGRAQSAIESIQVDHPRPGKLAQW